METADAATTVLPTTESKARKADSLDDAFENAEGDVRFEA